jgi:GNAT superfamily N-acetyltransferase
MGRLRPVQEQGDTMVNVALSIQPAEMEPSLYRVKPRFGKDECMGRQAWLAVTGGEWFVALVDDQVVGWVIVSWTGKRTHPEFPDMCDLYVAEAWRGQGIGTALIRFVERLAFARGWTRVGLAVNPELNPRALRLYTRLGYCHDGRPAYVDGIYDGVEDWVIDLEKPLTG